MEFNRILIIQTAFIGDVVLATPLVLKLNKFFPHASIDFLVRKGNEELLIYNKCISEILIWDKKYEKYLGLLRIIKKVRKKKYDLVINVQRYASTGILTWLSGATIKVGFDKNPFAFALTKRVKHSLDQNLHEVERNLKLIEPWTDSEFLRPSIEVGEKIDRSIKDLKKDEYLVIAPTSVWFTKQLPAEKWIKFLEGINFKSKIYLIGSSDDKVTCEDIRSRCQNSQVENLCGKLSLLQSVALIKDAKHTFSNDSAAQHFASALNAPVTTVFCSTIPEFGFGPLSDKSAVVQIAYDLECRPCGLHGYKKCPKGHFKCAKDIDLSSLEF